MLQQINKHSITFSHTKSWNKDVGKHQRGRSDHPWLDIKAVADAKAGFGLLSATRRGVRARDILTLVSPNYQSDFFTSSLKQKQQQYHVKNETAVSVGLCGVFVKDQEAYLDECFLCHLALGFASIYIYDSSAEFWMRDYWGEEMVSTCDTLP